jgi:plasmid stabilization system protein ParE
VRWTEVAWCDLEAAADYIARDSPHYAAAFVAEVRDAARSLERFARRGRVVPELAHPDVREISVRSYRLIYQTATDGVNVLAFIHGARDLAALWAHEERSPSSEEPK